MGLCDELGVNSENSEKMARNLWKQLLRVVRRWKTEKWEFEKPIY